MDKNKDLLFKDLSQAMFASDQMLLQTLFPEGDPEAAHLKRPTTTGKQFKVRDHLQPCCLPLRWFVCLKYGHLVAMIFCRHPWVTLWPTCLQRTRTMSAASKLVWLFNNEDSFGGKASVCRPLLSQTTRRSHDSLRLSSSRLKSNIWSALTEIHTWDAIPCLSFISLFTNTHTHAPA